MGDPRKRPEWELREEEEKLFSKFDTPLERTVKIIVLVGFCIGFVGWVAWILIWPFITLGLSFSGGFLAGILKMLF